MGLFNSVTKKIRNTVQNVSIEKNKTIVAVKRRVIQVKICGYSCLFSVFVGGVVVQEFDKEAFLECIKDLVRLDREWVPKLDNCSLYVRPTFIGTEVRMLK